MRQLWRFLRLFWTTLLYTTYVDLAARRVPPAERPRFRARHQEIGCGKLCRILGIDVTTEDVAPGGADARLAVCNHFGVLDPLVLASRMPVAFVAKAEVARWPLVGWITRTYGVIFVDRERRTATADFVEVVRARLAAGVRVLVFPEGGITHEVGVRPFKTGAFAAVAGDEDGSVLPLYLHAATVDGAAAVNGRHAAVVWGPGESFLGHFWRLTGLRHVEMIVHGGRAVPTRGHDRKALARLTHREVTALEAAAQGGLGIGAAKQ